MVKLLFTNMKGVIVVTLCLLTLHSSFVGCKDNPHLKLSLTRESVRFVIDELLQLLTIESSGLRFQGFSGSTPAGGGYLNYSIENLKLIEFPKPDIEVEIRPKKGIKLTFSNLTLRITTGWGYAYRKGIFRASNTGSGEVIINGTRLELNLVLDIDENWKPKINVTRCTPRLGTILYRLDDEALFYDLVIRIVRGKIRSAIEKGMCEGIKNGLNKDLNDFIQSTNFEANVGSNLTMDVGLTSAPLFIDDRIEVSISSKFKEDYANETIIDMKTTGGHMIGLYISQELFNSAARVLNKNKQLEFVHTTHTIMSSLTPFNITTASTGPDACFSFTISSSSSSPSIKISPNMLTMRAELIVSIALKINENITHNILRVPLSIECQLKIRVDDGQFVTTVYDVMASPGSISESGADLIKESIVKTASMIFSSISTSAGKHLPLPCKRCVGFKDTEVTLGDGYLVVATNLHKKFIN